MANTIDFNVSTNATTVLNQTATAAENTATGFKSAKAELRALNNQLLSMDQTSAEFKKAAARAAELKDSISDLGAEINANAGNAFEGLSNNVGLFGSRLMDLDLKGAGQALAGMGDAVGRIDFKTLKDEVGGLVSGFAKLAKAIISNPILLLATAVALVVANFDDLVKLFPSVEMGLTGINEIERENLAIAKAKADASQKAYDHIALEENALKLQGKTEREILQYRLEKLKGTIEDRKGQLLISQEQAKIQIQTSKRNREILEGIIKFLTAPLQALLGAVDEIAHTLGMDSDLANSFTNMAAGLLIDPQELETELNKTIEENALAIDKMVSDYAGLERSIQEIDKKKLDDKKATLQKEVDAYEKSQEEIDAIFQKWDEERIASEVKAREDYIHANQSAHANELYDLEQKQIKELELFTGSKEDKNLLLESYRIAEENINKKYDDLALQQQLDAAAKQKAADDKAKDEAKVAKDKEIEIEKAAVASMAELKIDAVKTSLQIIGDLAGAFAGQTERQQRKAFQIQKAASIATTTIDTYLSAQKAYASQMTIVTPDAPVRASLAAGIAIAQGLARVAIMAKQQFNGSGGTSGGGGGGTVPSPSGTTAPSPANYDFISQQPNQQPPLQAYVVGSQVSSNLEAQQLIQNQSRLGG
jgi:hypothetical protein